MPKNTAADLETRIEARVEEELESQQPAPIRQSGTEHIIQVGGAG